MALIPMSVTNREVYEHAFDANLILRTLQNDVSLSKTMRDHIAETQRRLTNAIWLCMVTEGAE